jgi:hypothetical protein
VEIAARRRQRRRRRGGRIASPHPTDDGDALAGGEAAFRRPRPAAGRGGEGDVDDGGDNEHVDGRVRGPRRADTGDGRRWRSRRDSDKNDDDEEGGSHPTPLTTATRELVVRLRSAGIPYALEDSLSDVDDVNGR